MRGGKTPPQAPEVEGQSPQATSCTSGWGTAEPIAAAKAAAAGRFNNPTGTQPEGGEEARQRGAHPVW